MAKRDAFLLRIDPAVLAAIRQWADDDMRSLNAQIEFLLREQLRAGGRSKSIKPTADDPSTSPPET
jgi:hypothetical protein